MKTQIAVFVSGGGTNLQALIDFAAAGKLPDGEIKLVLSSNPEAYALSRAEAADIAVSAAAAVIPVPAATNRPLSRCSKRIRIT